MADAVANALGEIVTVKRGETVLGSPRCILTRRTEPFFQGGEIIVDEEHHTARIPTLSLDSDPVVGDVIETAANVRYRIDAPPERAASTWRLIVRQL
jgi:hypothetical protein